MDVIQGDLLEMFDSGELDYILHGCNCFHTMGAGIAASISAAYPQAYDADCKTSRGDPAKLGTISRACVVINNKVRTICNCYTQWNTGCVGTAYNAIPIDYGAVRSCFKELAAEIASVEAQLNTNPQPSWRSFWGRKKEEKVRLKVGLPAIGCGLAGGSLEVLKELIQDELHAVDVVLVLYKGK